MSCSLRWRPIGDYDLIGGSALRDALRDEFGPFPFRLGRDAIPFLRGLRAAKVEGAGELIDLIEKHDDVEMDVSC